MGGTQPEPEDREGSRGGDTRRESSVCVWGGGGGSVEADCTPLGVGLSRPTVWNRGVAWFH